MRRMARSIMRNSAQDRMMDLALRWRRELRIVLRRLSSEEIAVVAAGFGGIVVSFWFVFSTVL